jgi:hypothetical protein
MVCESLDYIHPVLINVEGQAFVKIIPSFVKDRECTD